MSILVEIAERADVSVEGVVRVLTREPVSDAIKVRVLEVLDDLTPEQTRAVQRFALAALHDILERQGEAEGPPVPDPGQLALPVAAAEPDLLPSLAPDAALVQLSSVLGELAEAVRDLRRETDEERRERVDDLSVLIDLITTGWQGLDARLGRIERQVSRLESGRRETAISAPMRAAPPVPVAPPAPREPVPPTPPAEPSKRDRLPFVAVLTLIGAGVVTLAVLQLASGGPDLRRLVDARESSSTSGEIPASTASSTTGAPTTVRPPASPPTAPATTSDVLGTTSSASPRPEPPPAATTAPATTSAPPPATTSPGDAACGARRLRADTQLGLGAGCRGRLLRRRVHPRRHGHLPGDPDRVEADAARHGRLPARPSSLGRPPRLRRALREEPGRADRRFDVRRLLARRHGRGDGTGPKARARLGVEEVEPRRVERERKPVAGPHIGLLRDLGREEGAAVGCDQRRALAVVGGRPDRVHFDRRRVDGEEDVRGRAELLDDHHVDLDPRERRVGGAAVLEVLWPEAEDDRARPRRSRDAGRRRAES